MQAQLCISPSVSLVEYWQRSSPSPDRDTQALSARARGRCFNVAFVTPPHALASLVFRNFYTASLRLVQLNADGSTRILLGDYPLMAHAHCEDDAQNWHLIHLDQLRTPPDMAQLASLQFYLFQSSPRFETWDLQQLTLYESRSTDDNSQFNSVPKLQVTQAPGTSLPPPSMHQFMRRISRNSLLVVDARDVREHATQILMHVRELRQLVNESN